MSKKSISGSVLTRLLNSEQVRQVVWEDRPLYAVVDLIAALADSTHPDEFWNDLKQREPRLENLAEAREVASPDGTTALTDVVDLTGLLRVVQAIPSAKAERIKQWLAQGGAQRLEEMENPELAFLRARKLYQHQGYSRRWIDKRLRGMSARHELTGEWYKRGATESDQYRTLTNELMQHAFGMDVESYRRFKHLDKPSQNLRDNMNDLELILTMLAETTAAALHRDHQSQGYEPLLADVRDAGDVAAHTREEIERRTARAVVNESNFTAPQSRPWGNTAPGFNPMPREKARPAPPPTENPKTRDLEQPARTPRKRQRSRE
jgi:hypothetical protein